MHLVMYAFSNHAVVLHNVTPIDLPAQSAVLSDGVVFAYPRFRTSLSLSDLHTYAKVLHNVTPFVFAIRVISNSHK